MYAENVKPFGIPSDGKVRLWVNGNPAGFELFFPSIEVILDGRSAEEARNGVGVGICGHIPLHYPFPTFPTFDGDEVKDQALMEIALDEIRYYSDYFEICCIHLILNKPLPTCEPFQKPPPKERSFLNKISPDASASLKELARLCDFMTAAGMGGGATTNARASETLELVRDISGDKHYVISGDALGATGGMRHIMNLRSQLWNALGGKPLELGAWGQKVKEYDSRKGTNICSSGPAVASIIAAATYGLGQGEYLKALEAFDEVNNTSHAKSASGTQ